MSYAIVAAVAFFAGCEWMVLMKKRTYRRMERTMNRYFEETALIDGPGSGE